MCLRWNSCDAWSLALFSVTFEGHWFRQCETSNVILIYLEVATAVQFMLNLGSVTSIFCFQDSPLFCKTGISSTNVIGQCGSICSHFQRLCGCLGCLLQLSFMCCLVLVWLLLVRVKKLRAGSGGCWPVVSTRAWVICGLHAEIHGLVSFRSCFRLNVQHLLKKSRVSFF